MLVACDILQRRIVLLYCTLLDVFLVRGYIMFPCVARKLGVLCVAVQVAADGDRLLIVTGGDDHAICVAEVEISLSDRASECLENDQDRRGVVGEQRVNSGRHDRWGQVLSEMKVLTMSSCLGEYSSSR